MVKGTRRPSKGATRSGVDKKVADESPPVIQKKMCPILCEADEQKIRGLERVKARVSIGHVGAKAPVVVDDTFLSPPSRAHVLPDLLKESLRPWDRCKQPENAPPPPPPEGSYLLCVQAEVTVKGKEPLLALDVFYLVTEQEFVRMMADLVKVLAKYATWNVTGWM